MREWWRGAVIYQIYPRSFQDGNGDGVGDLPGVLRRLDHVADLGVDAIWLSPIFVSPMDDMGYDVSNYVDIDPLFGTLEHFDEIIEKAHRLGLKVIIDQVLSHTSDKHPWFRESRTSRTNARADWYVWADPNPDGTPPTNWPSVFGGPAWEWNGARRQYYLHNFLISQPDLNYHNPAVQDAALDVMRFWLERGVDGFRFDTVNYFFHDDRLRDNPPAPVEKETALETDPYGMQLHLHSKNRPENLRFLQRVRALLDEFPGTTSVGEVGEAHRALDIMAQYTADNDKLHMCYSFGMLGNQFTPNHFQGQVERFFAQAPEGWPCWSFSNHDVVRHVTRWGGRASDPQALGRLSIAMLLALRGSVCLYQGEELGLPEAELDYHELTDPPGIRFWPEHKGRDGCRTPMPWDEGVYGGFSETAPWLPVKAPHLALNVEGQNRAPASMLAYYREILAYRRAHDALVDGKARFLDAPDPVLAVVRTGADTPILAVFNLALDPVELTLAGVSGPARLADISSGARLEDGRLSLSGTGFAYVELDAPAPDLVLSGADPAA